MFLSSDLLASSDKAQGLTHYFWAIVPTLIIILVNKLKDPHEMIVTYLSPLHFPKYNM